MTRVLICALLATVVPVTASTPADPSPGAGRNSSANGNNTYALLIGVSDYSPRFGLPPLRFAATDAVEFKTFLKTKRGGSVPDAHIRLLTNHDATLDNIRSALAEFRPADEDLKSDNALIVFIAGHGADWNGSVPYFFADNSTAEDIRTTGLPLSELKALLLDRGSAFQRVIVYLDICRAGDGGLSVAQLGATGGAGTPSSTFAMLMATSTSKEYAYESERFGPPGHGALTFAVLEGLNGKAGQKDGEITFDALTEYVQQRVSFLTGRNQTPSASVSRRGIVVLADAGIPPQQAVGPGEAMAPAEARSTRTSASGHGPPHPATSSTDSTIGPDEFGYRSLSDVDLLRAAQAFADFPAGQPPADPVLRSKMQQLRVALEDRGANVISRYLRGEQEAIPKLEFDACTEYFREAQRFNPIDFHDRSRELLCTGRAAIFDHDYERAIGLLQNVTDLDPNDPSGFNALGLAYLELARTDPRNFSRATGAFELAVSLEPNWAYALHNLALVHSERGDFLLAAATYERAIRAGNFYSYLRFNLGLLYQNVNRLDDAERCYREAIAVAESARASGHEPVLAEFRERAIALNALATIQIARKRYRSALNLVDSALQDAPKLIEGIHNKALILDMMSRNGVSPDAENLWKEAIAANPDGVVERVAYADYLNRSGRSQEAQEELVKLLQIAPDNIDGLRILGRIHMSQKRPLDAVPFFDRVRRHLPGDALANEEFAAAAAGAGNDGEAVAAYLEAFRLYLNAADRRRIRSRLGLLGVRR